MQVSTPMHDHTHARLSLEVLSERHPFFWRLFHFLANRLLFKFTQAAKLSFGAYQGISKVLHVDVEQVKTTRSHGG